jgi:hypothetical protein
MTVSASATERAGRDERLAQECEDARLYDGVAAAVRAAIGPDADVMEEMRSACRTLRLVDERGELQVAELAASGLLDPLDAGAFVDRIARGASENPYLNAFMRRARGRSFAAARHANRDAVLRAATGYAAVLDRLTKAMRDDWRIVRAVRAHWGRAKQGARTAGVMNLFERAKVTTIEAVIGAYLDVQIAGEVPPSGGRHLIALNILEAAAEDLRLGYRRNASAALTLAMNPVGSRTHNPRTHAGPSRFSADGRTVLRCPPLPRRWADLYTTWNLAFVSHYPNFPFFFAKLLTPQVLCYGACPEEYMVNRTIALYAHIHHELFTRVDRAGGPGGDTVRWADDELTRLWSEVNAESAGQYARELCGVDPQPANTVKRIIAGLLRSSEG